MFLSIGFVFAQDQQTCFFGFENSNCQEISSSFVNFNLNFIPSNSEYIYSAELYNKNNIENKLLLNISGNIIRNINPFVEPGVYVLDVKVTSKSGISKEFKKEFIFNNLAPAPPILPMRLNSSIISGETNMNGVIVHAKDITNGKTAISQSNGTFSMNLDLNNGINLVNFYTENSQGLISNKIGRIIYNGGIPKENLNLNANSISIDNNLDKINYRTYKNSNGVYITSKRDFYVSGSVGNSEDGTVVFVNGIKSIVKSGKFASNVLLNDGLNKIIVENVNGNIKKDISVKYIPTNFKFLTFKMNKIVKTNFVDLSGTTNMDIPFNLYLNGKFITKVYPKNGVFNYHLENLNSKRNFIFLSGLNNQKISDIVYVDREKPRAEVLTNENVTPASKFVFKITDDIGVDDNSVILKIGNKTFSGSDFTIYSDYFEVSLNNFSDGTYNYEIDYKDRSGRSGNKVTGRININKNNTLIERFNLGNFGYQLGNTLFLNSKEGRIILEPTKFIAFNSIYLDGKRQTNYEIESNKNIILNLTLTRKNGSLDFTFINFKHQKFTQHFNYFTDLEKPHVKLDYINNPNGNGNNFVKITGEIIDSNFDWSSLRFNSNSNFIRFGNYFEAEIPLQETGVDDLIISGNDFSKNLIDDSTFYLILYDDTTYSKVIKHGVSKYGFHGTLSNTKENRNKNFLLRFSGINYYPTYLNQYGFILSPSEMEGLRSVNLNGVEESGNRFKSFDVFDVDSIPPRIYFVQKGLKNEIIIDGTLSKVENLEVEKNRENVDFSYCTDSVSLNSLCLVSNDFSSGDIVVSGNDAAGNKFRKILTQSDIVSFSSINSNSSELPEFYFNGNDNQTIFSNYFLQGNIKSLSIVKSVTVDGKKCDFNDISFVCNVSLLNGTNNFSVDVANKNGDVKKNFIIKKLSDDFGLKLFNLSGDGVYYVGGKYYIRKPNLILSGGVNKKALLSLLIDNRNYLTIGYKSSNFSVNVNLSNQISQKEKSDFYIKLKAENDYGQSQFSKKFEIVYNRIIKTLVKVFLY